MQVAVRGDVPIVGELTREVVEEMIHERARTGRNPSGLQLDIVRWKNPARRGARAGWRSGHQGDAWQTLRGPLRRARVDSFTVRRGETLGQ